MPKNPWKAWHEVVSLRDDLRSGELPLQMFAADLYEVVMQRGKQPVYEDPASFFALTYPTYNLRQLVRDVIHRIAGKNDKAVRQLELTYGGGKTHTLITLYHLAMNPAALPNLPAVEEFREAVDGKLTQARVAALSFDKLDVEKGMEIVAPDGTPRWLREPWSVLAWQLAGDEGLRLLHADSKSEERESAPAENLLTALLEIPTQKGLGVLVLIDEVLMYAREKAGADPAARSRLVNFFQYLTQAATKVPRCCIVASLLASDPAKEDSFGKQLQSELYAIFQRQREEAVEPVVKADVAELLRRRFFTPDSIRDINIFRPHVQAALKGIAELDEQTRREGPDAEKRYLASFPFHPDLTEVFYTKWTSLKGFQRARGVLRTFALALRAAERWDPSPLVTTAALLHEPGSDDLSEAMRELITVADQEEHEGKKQSWSAIVQGELSRAREIQRDSARVNFREIEQSVIATFLHSQPAGRTAQTRDLKVLAGTTRPDPIELDKGLKRWFQVSYWLEDQYAAQDPQQLPSEWKLGHRPNLNQMHAVSVARFSDDVVRARLLEEIGKAKQLVTGASASGVRVHVLPQRPRDIEDDGQFHYAVVGPAAASDSGKPSAEARRFLDETSSPDKPRVHRNAVILLAPSNDGLALAMARVRDHLGWLDVQNELKKDSGLDPARMATLALNVDTSRNRIVDAIRQAYSTVVTVSRENEVHAFKINVTDEAHFITLKNDSRSRIQETAVTADALLPGGPYDLWKSGETSRRVKDLTSAFASHPHLPKMLKAQAIHQTLMDGCEQGMFVLKLARPDKSVRTWWRSRVDDVAINDPAIELVLSEAAELAEVPHQLLVPGVLPELWSGSSINVQAVRDYFAGKTVVRNAYGETAAVPKANPDVVDSAIKSAVEAGNLWLVSGPTSLLAEPVPHGVIAPSATLQAPPPPIGGHEILSQTLPGAWESGTATALSIATSLSHRFGQTLPWKNVRDVIDNAIRARFLDLDPTSGSWPCDFSSARSIRLKESSAQPLPSEPSHPKPRKANTLVAEAELAPRELQDLGDVVSKLLDIKAKHNFEMRIRVQIEVDGASAGSSPELKNLLNQILKDVNTDLEMS